MFPSSARWSIRMNSAAAVIGTPHAPFDRALLLVMPAAAFMLLLFVYPFLYGLALSFNPEGGRRAGELFALLHHRQPVADDLDDIAPRAAGDADQRRPRAADCVQDAGEIAHTSAGRRRSWSFRSRWGRC